MNSDITVKTTKGEYALNWIEFPDAGVSIRLPENLSDLPEEERQKLFSTSESTAIKADFKNKIFFSLNSSQIDITEDQSEEESVLGLMAAQQKAISRLTPGYQEYGIRKKKIDGGHIIACLDFKSNSLENDIYNIFCLFIHKGRMISGTFSCLLEDEIEWNIVFLACLDSLNFIEG